MLTLTKISKIYGKKQALQDVNLTLENGIYGLLGPNGAGKSTLMNIITQNLKPTTGSILWDGQEIHKMGSTYRSFIGYAPQQQGLYDTFTGERFLSYMATLKGISKKHQKEEIQRVLSCVNLVDDAHRLIGTYSGGMKQRILVAQAILGNPRFLILDEPTAGLDPKERVRIRENIREIAEDKIILVSTHVVSDIQSIANHIILLKQGKIVDQGSISSLCEKYHTKHLEQVYLEIFEEEETYALSHSI